MKHALIIEDDPLVSCAIEDRLMLLGFRSFEKAWTEEDAVAAADRRKPDLVVVGDSLESGSPMRAARRISEAQDVPVLLVTDRSAGRPVRLPEDASISGPYPLGALGEAIEDAERPVAIPVAA